MSEMKKRCGAELLSGIAALVLSIAALVLSIAALVLFCMSYTTGYYTFGQMQSGLITLLLAGVLILEVVSPVLRLKYPNALWAKFLTFGVTGLLAGAAALLLGDRVEGIGNCIITDYDSGHGGEEAIYLSIVSVILMLAAMVYNIIGSFFPDKPADAQVSKKKKIGCISGFGVSCAAVLLAAVIAAANLAGGSKASGTAETASGQAARTYSVSYSHDSVDIADVPGYLFLCGNVRTLIKYDSRFYVDITLTLDGSGNYSIFSDSYIIEGGERAKVGDASGLGLVMTAKAEGAYTENADGTVTTSAASHVLYELQTDTYSAQMKDMIGFSIDGKAEDGIYDSADYAEILETAPETVWTLEEGVIVFYHKEGEEPIVQETAEEETETGSGTESATLEIASDDEATTMTFSADGTYCFSFAEYGIEDRGIYAYDGTTLTVTNASGTEVTAEGDPLKLHYAASQSDQLTGDFTIAAADLTALVNGEMESETTALEVASDDEATTMTFSADGTYCFSFAEYGIEDKGTYAYDGTTLTVTNASGTEVTAEGDPLKLHYAASQSDQLTGDFTIAAADLTALVNGETGSETEEPAGLEVVSDDGNTTMTFSADGTYCFSFAEYGIEDKGTYAYDGTTLTVTNANGTEITAEGDPLKLHYAASQSDQLTGDFTIAAAELMQVTGD